MVTPATGEHPTDSMRLRGAPALRLHLTLAIGLLVCVVAFVIEIFRALGGNTLSWCYVFEWPILGGFGTYVWWSLLHGHDRRRSRHRALTGTKASSRELVEAPGDASSADRSTTSDGHIDDQQHEDPDLDAWNAYLRSLERGEFGRRDT